MRKPIFFILLSFLVVAPFIFTFLNYSYGAVVFNDGYESGDFTAWDGTTGTNYVVSTNPASGTYHSNSTNSGNSIYVDYTAMSYSYYNVSLRVSALPSSNYESLLLYSVTDSVQGRGVFQVGIYKTGAGVVCWYVNYWKGWYAQEFSSITPVVDTYYEVSLYVVCGSSAEFELYIDDVIACSQSGYNCYSTTVDRLYVGCYYEDMASAVKVFTDDVYVLDAWEGGDPPVPTGGHTFAYTGFSGDLCLYYDDGDVYRWQSIGNGYWIDKAEDLMEWDITNVIIQIGFEAGSGTYSSRFSYSRMNAVLNFFGNRSITVTLYLLDDYWNYPVGWIDTEDFYDVWLDIATYYDGDDRISAFSLYSEMRYQERPVGWDSAMCFERFANLTKAIHAIDVDRVVIYPYWGMYSNFDNGTPPEVYQVSHWLEDIYLNDLDTENYTLFDVSHPYYFENYWYDMGLAPIAKANYYLIGEIDDCIENLTASKCYIGETFGSEQWTGTTYQRQYDFMVTLINGCVSRGIGLCVLSTLGTPDKYDLNYDAFANSEYPNMYFPYPTPTPSPTITPSPPPSPVPTSTPSPTASPVIPTPTPYDPHSGDHLDYDGFGFDYVTDYRMISSEEFLVQLSCGYSTIFQLTLYNETFPYISIYANASDFNATDCSLWYADDLGGKFIFTADCNTSITVGTNYEDMNIHMNIGGYLVDVADRTYDIVNGVEYVMVWSSFGVVLFNVNVSVAMSAIVVLLVLLLPAIGLTLLIGKWGFLAGWSMGAIIGYMFLPSVGISFPDWALFIVVMVDAGIFLATWKSGD